MRDVDTTPDTNTNPISSTRLSIFRVPQRWSSLDAIRSGPMKSLDESKWLIATITSVLLASEFHKAYNASASSPGRFQRALRPALRSVPQSTAIATCGHVMAAGTSEKDGVKTLLGVLAGGTTVAIAGGRHALSSTGSRASALLIAGIAVHAGYCLLQEQTDEPTKDTAVDDAS